MGKYKYCKERQAALEKRDQDFDALFRLSNKRFKKFDELIEMLYDGTPIPEKTNDGRILAIQNILKDKNGARKLFTKDVFIFLEKNSLVMKSQETIKAIGNAVEYNAYWIRDPRAWKPVSKSEQGQLTELLRWLFCNYEMPAFMFRAFDGSKDSIQIKWFIHLAQGGRARDLEKVPIVFTQKMAHYFLQAPAQYSIKEALRWAQAKGLGAEDELAKRFISSWIGHKPYSNEPFWQKFMLLVVNGGIFNYQKLGEVIDYVRECLREDASYHLKGRNLQSLIRQSDQWHYRFRKVKVQHQQWKPSGLETMRIKHNEEALVLEELTSSKELALEGTAMKHCVYSYAYRCAKGDTAIFSLRKYVHGVMAERLATIEVNMQMSRIVQAKAKMNRGVSAQAHDFMSKWALAQGLTVNGYL